MTRHVLDQLPLWIEGDLPHREAEAVQVHLRHCPSCGAEAERLRTSQAWLRDAMAPPFDAADLLQLRGSVLERLRLEPPHRPVRRLLLRSGLLAASAAALLLAALASRPDRPAVLPPPEPRVSAAATPLKAGAPAPDLHRPAARAASPPAREPVSALPEGPSRIEFQTSDPTVRIIWLARATPLPDANPSLQEAP